MAEEQAPGAWLPPCGSCCPHGGICPMDSGHDGPHDSGYCTWTDDEAISRVEADAILLTSGNPIAAPLLAVTEALERQVGL